MLFVLDTVTALNLYYTSLMSCLVSYKSTFVKQLRHTSWHGHAYAHMTAHCSISGNSVSGVKALGYIKLHMHLKQRHTV